MSAAVSAPRRTFAGASTSISAAAIGASASASVAWASRAAGVTADLPLSGFTTGIRIVGVSSLTKGLERTFGIHGSKVITEPSVRT